MGTRRRRFFPRSAALFGLAAVGILAAVSGAVAAGPVTVQSLETQRHAAVLDLYALDSHVSAAQAAVASLRRQADVLRAQAQLLELQVGATRITLRTSQRQLAANLRNLYKHGEINTLAVVLGAQSLDDAVSQIDTINAVAAQDKRVVTVTTRAQRRLTRLQRTLATRRARVGASVRAAQRTLADLNATRARRVAFIAELRTKEQLKAAQIEALQARVAAAQAKSAQLTAARAAAPDPASVTQQTTTAAAAPAPAPQPSLQPVLQATTRSGRSITVTSTGYSLPGHTATGLPVGWGVIAVDPSVIPLGTKLTIPGYGEAVAADTGSAVRGHDIDIWFPTLAQARAWGRRTITITLH